jgi:hypothetical protein
MGRPVYIGLSGFLVIQAFVVQVSRVVKQQYMYGISGRESAGNATVRRGLCFGHAGVPKYCLINWSKRNAGLNK